MHEPGIEYHLVTTGQDPKTQNYFWMKFGPMFTGIRPAVHALCITRQMLPEQMFRIIVDTGEISYELSEDDEIVWIADRELKEYVNGRKPRL